MKKSQKITLELDDKEFRILKFILDYAYHRSSCHKTPVTCYEDFLDKLREEIKR